MNLIDDNEDYFLHDFDETPADTPATPPAQADPAQPTQPADTPAAPARQPRPRRRRVWPRVCLILLLILAAAFYIRYYMPYVTDSKIRGYVTNVEKRGLFFRTFEGEMISEAQLVDTARVYQRDVTLSLPDDSLGRVLQSWQGTGRPVVVTVRRYYGTLPWRGATNTIVTDIQPAH